MSSIGITLGAPFLIGCVEEIRSKMRALQRVRVRLWLLTVGAHFVAAPVLASAAGAGAPPSKTEIIIATLTFFTAIAGLINAWVRRNERRMPIQQAAAIERLGRVEVGVSEVKQTVAGLEEHRLVSNVRLANIEAQILEGAKETRVAIDQVRSVVERSGADVSFAVGEMTKHLRDVARSFAERDRVSELRRDREREEFRGEFRGLRERIDANRDRIGAVERKRQSARKAKA